MPCPTDDGRVLCWRNRDDHAKARPAFLSGLRGIVRIAAGQNIALALAEDGKLQCWRPSLPAVPITLPPQTAVVQMACGRDFAMLRSAAGAVLVWGSNSCGQQARGKLGGACVLLPTEVRLPAAATAIAAGDGHAAVVLCSGSVYLWGDNAHGQAGGDSRYVLLPRRLPDVRACAVAAGAAHTVVLDVTARLHGLGSNASGQLAGMPLRVHAAVAQLHAGRHFSLLYASRQGDALLPDDAAQLAALSTATLERLLLSHGERPRCSSCQAMRLRLTACTRCSSALVCDSPACTDAHACTAKRRRTASSSCSSSPVAGSHRQRLLQCASFRSRKAVAQLLRTVFSSPACLSVSWLSDSASAASAKSIDCEDLLESCRLLEELDLPQFEQRLWSFADPFVQSLAAGLPVRSLRAAVVLLLQPSLRSTDVPLPTACGLLSALLARERELQQWLALVSDAALRSVVESVQVILDRCLAPPSDAGYALCSISMLQALREANSRRSSKPLGRRAFYNQSVTHSASLWKDYVVWQRQPSASLFCRVPWLLEPAAKQRLMVMESQFAMAMSISDALCRGLRDRSALAAAGGSIHVALPQLQLTVDRWDVLASLEPLLSMSSAQLRRPLRVSFKGEEGVDQGGLSREFFHLAVPQLLATEVGIFQPTEDGRLHWFQPHCADAAMDSFRLLGTLLALALFNGITLNLPVPLALFKLLLGQPCELEDLREVDDTLFRSLKRLLELDGDVSSLALDYEIAVPTPDGGTTVVLRHAASGEPLQVTEWNRSDFVKQYIDYIFHKLPHPGFAALHAGFRGCCDSKLLALLQAEELQLMLCGTADYDFHALQGSTALVGFEADDPTVTAFWHVVHSLPLQQKRALLRFATGSDRVPLEGMAALSFKLQRNGPDSDRLPCASTCFNTLLLPAYSCESKLRERLLCALQHSLGFGVR
eukprot:PLAT15478.5.p1 GENE.PLAT15478.5~~PLAT15478.5.p1  ORF type:complete len:938 (-),score=369.49 PLAT15478.5:1820-4633(-)